MNIDLSNKDCLKAVTNIGETIYMNICDGSQSAVPWGTTDWFMVGWLSIMVVIVAAFFGFITYQIFRGRRYL